MEFYEVVQARRSVRRFKPEAVADEKIERAINAALLAPNSSNLQTWEFYWVKSQDKKQALATACMGQGAARTAAHLIVAVARMDTWRRNNQLMLEHLKKDPKTKKIQTDYYGIHIPALYFHDWFGIWGALRFVYESVKGWFKPVMRSPYSQAALYEVITKSTALGCENLMLALTAEGLGSCPMEGFDELRVKKILGLPRFGAHVTMVIGTGMTDPKGLYGERLRFDRRLFVKEI